MERQDESPRFEVRPIELDPERAETVDFGGSGSRRPLPGAAKWLVAVAVLVAAGFYYLHRDAPAPPAASPPPVASSFTAGGSSAVPTSTTPSVVNVGSPLLGVRDSWELFGRTDNGLVRIQPARGRITLTPVPPLNSSAPSTMLIGTRMALIVSFDHVVGYGIADGEPARILSQDVHPNGEPIPGPDPDHLWIVGSDGTQATLVNLAGRSAGSTLVLPRDTDINGVLPDGAGYLLAVTPHGVYDIGHGGRTRVTVGQVLASGPIGWLVTECDKQLQCSAIVVNRATGARTRIGSYRYLAPAVPGLISPDGRKAAVLALNGDGGGTVTIIDLATNADHLLDISLDQDATEGFVWSPDSKWLFVADGSIVAINAATAKQAPFTSSINGVLQVAIRSH